MSLPFCNGEHIIPLLKKLRQENVAYYVYATQILLHQVSVIYVSVVANPKGSFLEQLISWMGTYIKMYKERENRTLNESQLSVIFDFKLHSLLENYNNQKIKEKGNLPK